MAVAASWDPVDARAPLSRADQKLAERVPAYLRNCRESVLTMGDALDRSDFDAVTILGHNLRGSGGGFGFQALTDIGAGLELAAATADMTASRQWVVDLSAYLDRVGPNPLAN